jgi:hypothetical protein
MHSDPPALPAHGDDHNEPLDLEPVRTLPPDEAPSPAWLPLLGAALLLVLLTGWAVSRAGTAAPGLAESATLPVPAASQPLPGAPSAMGVPRLPPERRAGTGARRERSPEELEKVRELRRKFEEQRAK